MSVFSIYYLEGRKYYITSTVTPYLLPFRKLLKKNMNHITQITDL